MNDIVKWIEEKRKESNYQSIYETYKYKYYQI